MSAFKRKALYVGVLFVVLLILIAITAKTVKIFIWLSAAIGLYAIYKTLTNTVKSLKQRKTQ